MVWPGPPSPVSISQRKQNEVSDKNIRTTYFLLKYPLCPQFFCSSSNSWSCIHLEMSIMYTFRNVIRISLPWLSPIFSGIFVSLNNYSTFWQGVPQWNYYRLFNSPTFWLLLTLPLLISSKERCRKQSFPIPSYSNLLIPCLVISFSNRRLVFYLLVSQRMLIFDNGCCLSSEYFQLFTLWDGEDQNYTTTTVSSGCSVGSFLEFLFPLRLDNAPKAPSSDSVRAGQLV